VCTLSAEGKKVFAIDPGHGGSANSGSMAARTLSSPNNAHTPSGILEKTLTLELSLEIAAALERLGSERGIPVEVRLTRRGDENPDFAERARRCLGNGPPPVAIVSIHFNASDGHNARGSLGMVAAPDHNPGFARDKTFAATLASACASGVAASSPGAKARQPITDAHLHGGKGSNFFHQIQLIPELRGIPKCFLEVEFIDRKDVDDGLIRTRSSSFPKIANAIARALLATETTP